MQLLNEYLLSLGICSRQAADAEEKLRIYRDFLWEKNKQFNLTAITDPVETEIKHFIDSLAGLPFIQGDTADIGTGAGFPGLPLAILLPQYRFTLIDSLQKRICFLDELITLLHLDNVQTVHARAEDLPKQTKYQNVVSRAVAYLPTLCEYCLPFVKIGGSFIAYKSADCDREIEQSQKAISLLGGRIEKVHTVTLPKENILRKLICIRKIKETPALYPRNGNKPKKQPLS